MFFDLHLEFNVDKFKYPIFDKLTQNQLGYFGDLRKFLYKKIVLIIKY